MIVLENVVGVLAVLFTIAAYYQVSRLAFLKLNVLAVSFFGLSLMLNQGFSGGVISFINVLVYVFAIFAGKVALSRSTYVIPPLSFLVAYVFYSSGVEESSIALPVLNAYVPFVPAIATFVVSLSALQHNIMRNKVLLFIGVAIWAVYSVLVTAWYAFAADLVGLIVIVISTRKLLKLKSEQSDGFEQPEHR